MGLSLKNVEYISEMGTPWEKDVLHDINLDLQLGESMGVMGPSGSGKSTLFKVISGLISPSDGVIKSSLNESCLVFQEPHRGFFSASIWDEVAYGLKIRKVKKDIIEEKVAQTLYQLMIPETYWQRSPFQLSGGEQRRLAIACALVIEPEILLIDEPTVGLDGTGYQKMLELLHDIKANQPIFLGIISHDTNFLYRLTERVVLLNNGRLLFDSSWDHWQEFCDELASIKISLPLALQMMNESIANALKLPNNWDYQETVRFLRSLWKARRL